MGPSFPISVNPSCLHATFEPFVNAACWGLIGPLSVRLIGDDRDYPSIVLCSCEEKILLLVLVLDVLIMFPNINHDGNNRSEFRPKINKNSGFTHLVLV